MVNGKPVLVKGSQQQNALALSNKSIEAGNRKIIEVDHENRKLSSLGYLRASKSLKAPRWTLKDEQKFYDALKVFGENCDLIHSVVFDSAQAKKRYKNPTDFSERSIVQLKKKFKKDGSIIDKLL